MIKRWFSAVLFLSALLGGTVITAFAQTDCETLWDPIAQGFVVVCTGNGGGGSGGGGDGGGSGGGSCTPGTTTVSTVIIGGGGLCEIWEIRHDVCTGQVIYANLIGIMEGGACSVDPPSPGGAPPENPCVLLDVSSGGVFCRTDWGINGKLEARVQFPAVFLDLRPYPATLVRWPSAARNGGMPQRRGVGRTGYIPYGGGNINRPALGDWKDVRLTLTLKPASPIMFFRMPTLGTFALPDVGPEGAPQLLIFEKPSHPSAGANTTAGDIGLAELPSDFPLFAGSAKTVYRLVWRLSFDKYIRDCISGPDPGLGSATCKVRPSSAVNDGHWANLWVDRSRSGEITPQMVADLPDVMAADLDGDGVPDAYWNRRVTVRRMDAQNRIDHPDWAGTWQWGGSVFWGVREGQGQIAWP